jgi:3-hydroxybutyrate dehydrogenase
MSLKGRVAIVTGGGGAIGRATALKLAAAGAAVAVADIRLDAAEETAKLVNAAGGQALPIAADVGSPEQIELMVRETLAALERIDVLVSNAGASEPARFLEVRLEEFEKVMRVNVTAALLGAQAAARDMAKRGWGRIVNIASAHGLVGSPFKSAYVAAKHGVVGLSKVVALEAAQSGVTCNTICPGYVWTPLVEKQIEDQARTHGVPRDKVVSDILLKAQPNKRFAQTSEIGALVAFLCSDSAASISGAALPVDGGWTAQ